MTTLQKKTLDHVSKTLKNFDTYPVYKAVSDILNEQKVSDEIRKAVLAAIQEETYAMKQIVTDAKDWLDAMQQKD